MASPRWEADVLLSDGGTAHVRPIEPGDGDLLRALHSRLSERSRYFRFFGAHPRLSDREVERFTVVDQQHRVALVALVGGEMIAVARYEGRAGQSSAEVAFVVDDAHQGRGLGSVLLEHLAAAAAERGITRFEADVLADNRGMLRVFHDAGYAVEHASQGATVRLGFDVAPTARSTEVLQAREHAAEARSVARLLAPRSIAVVGASSGGGAGAQVVQHLLAGGFDGEVLPVHPRGGRVAGVAAATSLLGRQVDLVVVATPPAAVPQVVEDAAAAAAHGLVVVSSVADPAALVIRARSLGVRVVGPTSYGVLSTATRLNASLAPVLPPAGGIGFFSQSAPLGAALLATVEARGLGVSAFLSAGDRADVSGNDVLQFFDDDDRTEVVVLSIEGFGNPRKFMRVARRVTARKPVVLVRPGPVQPEDALLDQVGVVRVGSVPEAFDVAAVLLSPRRPRTTRVQVVAAAAVTRRLAAATLSDAGLTPVAEAADDDTVLALLAAVPGSDALLADVERRHVGGPLVVSVLGGDPGVDVPAHVPVFAWADDAIRGTAAAAHWGTRSPAPSAPPGDTARVEEAVALLAGRPDGEQPADVVASLLAAYGVVVVPATPVATVEEAVAVASAVEGPVALKADDAGVRHRLDLGGVQLHLVSEADVRAAWDAVRALTAGPVVVQAMAPAGEPTVVVGREDPLWGPVVGFGVGGVPTELLGDRVVRSAPLTAAESQALVLAPRAAALLTGHRGSPRLDTAALATVVLAVAQLTADLPAVARVELNPVVAHTSGCSVLRAALELGPPRRADTGPRRLTVRPG